jgi:hypothetical protein
MLLSLAIWAFEAIAAAAISAVVTASALFIGLALWLHTPLHEKTASEMQPMFAVDDYAKEG